MESSQITATRVLNELPKRLARMIFNGPTFWAIIIALVLFTPALWTRSAWSGVGFSSAKLVISAIYNVFIIYIHMKFARDAELPIIGTVEAAFPVWLTLALVVCHGCCVPSEEEKNYLNFNRRKINISLIVAYPKTRNGTVTDKILRTAKYFILILCCSASATAISISGLAFVVSLSVTGWRTLGLFLFLAFISLALIAIGFEKRKP